MLTWTTAAAVAMKQRNCASDLAVAGGGHLQMGFNQMRHRAADAAMAVAQEPPWVLTALPSRPK